MPSQFFGLTIAGSGLNAYQVAINTSANNVSNVQTEGYSKQVATRTAASALRVNARYGSAGSGVEAESIDQLREQYYDNKYWRNQSSVGLYDTRYDYAKQIENYFIDDGKTGFTSVLATMFNNLDTLKTNSGDMSVRNQFISSASSLAEYFQTMAQGMMDLQEDLNSQVKSCVDNINSIAEKISILNGQINVLEVQGGKANELRDERALLIDRLSELVPVDVKEIDIVDSNNPGSYTGAKEFIVDINGQTIVDGKTYFELEAVARQQKLNQSDAEGLYEIKWAATGNSFNAGSKANIGKLKALLEMRDGNNAEQLSGTVSSATGTSVTFENPSITSLNKLTLPETGTIKIGSVYYEYESFNFDIEVKDVDGESVETITRITFDILAGTNLPEEQYLRDKPISQGAKIDYMGIPYYQAQLNEFVRAFAKEFNAHEKEGKYLDAANDLKDMGAFWVATDSVTGEEHDFDWSTDNKEFASPAGLTINDQTGHFEGKYIVNTDVDSYYKLTALNLHVASASVRDPNIFSTSTQPQQGVDSYDVAEALLKLKDDVILYRGCAASDFLQCMYTDSSVDTEKAKLFSSNYDAMQLSIGNQRKSISGVDEDEEALDLVKFQNAYSLSSKVVQTLTEIYDRLILNTGV